MKRSSALSDKTEELLGAIRQRLEQDPLCLELRYYEEPDANGAENQLILIIMQRELTQPERQAWMESLNALAAGHGLHPQILFSSPRVWQDLVRLVGTFERIDRKAHTVWARVERI